MKVWGCLHYWMLVGWLRFGASRTKCSRGLMVGVACSTGCKLGVEGWVHVEHNAGRV